MLPSPQCPVPFFCLSALQEAKASSPHALLPLHSPPVVPLMPGAKPQGYHLGVARVATGPLGRDAHLLVTDLCSHMGGLP